MSEAPAGLEHWAMRLSPKIHQILDILSDGRFHSGELIGQAIGISRERVSVYIRELRSKGVQVFSLQRKGYSLPAPAELLDEKRLNESLGGARIECVDIIDSTNSYLLARINESESGECVLAEMQTAGRGRRGHTWVSPSRASSSAACAGSSTALTRSRGSRSPLDSRSTTCSLSSATAA